MVCRGRFGAEESFWNLLRRQGYPLAIIDLASWSTSLVHLGQYDNRYLLSRIAYNIKQSVTSDVVESRERTYISKATICSSDLSWYIIFACRAQSLQPSLSLSCIQFRYSSNQAIACKKACSLENFSILTLVSHRTAKP